MLHTSFHIGDELVAINDSPVTSVKAAVNMLKSCADKTAAHLILKRLPVAHVCLLKRRDNQFENLGLRTVEGTAEVSDSISHVSLISFITV